MFALLTTPVTHKTQCHIQQVVQFSAVPPNVMSSIVSQAFDSFVSRHQTFFHGLTTQNTQHELALLCLSPIEELFFIFILLFDPFFSNEFFVSLFFVLCRI
jgi:hypothetical protein